ncbi:MAG: FemAB family XrtA/PEP-CTERM system-associated protein [Sphingomonas sp.]
MTMPLPAAPLGLRAADLGEAAERQRIDAFVGAHPDATPFHLAGWSLGVARGCGQAAHYLVAERSGAIAGVLPLSAVRSRLFGSALVSSGFAVDGGVLAHDTATAEALVDEAWRLAQRLGCPTLELRGGAAPAGDWHVDADTYLGFARALAADDEAELKAIPRKQRAEVRKALAADLTVETGGARHDLAAHYGVYAESVRNLGTPVFPPALFREVMEALGEAADILTVRHRGKPVASVLSLYLNGTVYPYWGGGTLEARALRANDRMYFALMSHARSRGCTRFDFGRSKAGTGAAAFKKNWGFEPRPLSYAIRSAAGAAPRAINPMSPRYRLQVAAWKRLPLWLANRLGPPIARGLG